MSLKQRLSWQIYNQLILLNNLYQISVNSALIKTPVPGSRCMVYKIVGATCFPCLCLLVEKYTLLRVKIKKHQPGININC